MSHALWAWWDALPAQRRDELLDLGSCEPSPDLALALWRTSRGMHAVEPETWSVDADPSRWRLTAEVRDFLGLRQYERQHPGK